MTILPQALEKTSMTTYVNSALFVYSEKTEALLEALQNNEFGTQLNAISFDSLFLNPQASLEGVEHVIIAGSLVETKECARNNFLKQPSLNNEISPLN
ncbi:hypothetical protein BMR07_05665 [Methylococcaceae bacterium CS1]|nr:hypothetical protein BMR07_05665 [Methylococcaceae bacterium CS1]